MNHCKTTLKIIDKDKDKDKEKRKKKKTTTRDINNIVTLAILLICCIFEITSTFV